MYLISFVMWLIIFVLFAPLMCKVDPYGQKKGSRKICPHINPGPGFPFTIGFIIDDRHTRPMVKPDDWDNIRGTERDTISTDKGKKLTTTVSMKGAHEGTRVWFERVASFGLPKGRMTCESLTQAMLVNNGFLHGLWEEFAVTSYSDAIEHLSYSQPYRPIKAGSRHRKECKKTFGPGAFPLKTYQDNSWSLEIVCGSGKVEFHQASREELPHGLCLNKVHPGAVLLYCEIVSDLFRGIGQHLESTLTALRI